MFRSSVCMTLILLLIGCSFRPAPPISGTSGSKMAENGQTASAIPVNHPSPSRQGPVPEKDLAVKDTPVAAEKVESPRQEKTVVPVVAPPTKATPLPQERNVPIQPDPPVTPAKNPPLKTITLSAEKGAASKPEPPVAPVKKTPLRVPSPAPEKGEPAKGEQKVPQLPDSPVSKMASSPKKTEVSKTDSKPNPSKPPTREGSRDHLEEAERDIMEEALLLLNESHHYWVSGDYEEALVMLDQAYAILLDTNGNPDIARQKDDLRLLISKRILTLYNSTQTNAKGVRSEIPIVTNIDVEKEIRQFQTVERDFFISSYHRSALYRPMILRELKKAGLPEELSWLPLVESGFKINALSTARALGLWQFIPSTGYKYGLNRDNWIDERMDMEKSTRAAIDYMKELHTMFGDWLTVLAAYNCGEGRIIRTIASQHINYLDRFWDLYYKLPYETARYVPRFIATVLIIKDPQKYGFDLGPGKTSALSYEMVEVNKSLRLSDIARKLEISEETLCILNAELRHKTTPDRPYKLRVPTETTAQLLRVVDDIPQADVPREVAGRKRSVTIKHTVRQGDTLALIAGKYKTSVGAIRTVNRLSKKGSLVVGQKLTVPIKTTSPGNPGPSQKSDTVISHQVVKGDTLASIARKYGTRSSEIRKTNHLEGDKLKIGQTLWIQTGEREPAREQKRESLGDHKGNVKQGANSTADRSTITPVGKKYTVKKGDSLSRIASENNTTPEKLRQLNKLSNSDIYPGQVVHIK